MEPEDCGECSNNGWIWDDLSSATGSRWWKYCDCEYGESLGRRDYEEYWRKKEQNPYKECPTCSGAGKIPK